MAIPDDVVKPMAHAMSQALAQPIPQHGAAPDAAFTALSDQGRSTASTLALRKELAIARGNLARLKIRREVDQIRHLTNTAGSVAQAAAVALALSGGIQAWRHRHRAVAAPSSGWAEALKLLGALVWFVRRERTSAPPPDSRGEP